MIKMWNLSPQEFTDVKSLCRLENQSKNVRKKTKTRWSIWSAIMPSVTQQVSKIQNGRCFGSVLLSFLKCLLMAATKGKTVGYLDLLSCVWYQSLKTKLMLYIGARWLLYWWAKQQNLVLEVFDIFISNF